MQFDGSLLVITDPVETVVTDTFFINAYMVLESGKGVIRNFVSKDNTYVSAACMSWMELCMNARIR